MGIGGLAALPIRLGGSRPAAADWLTALKSTQGDAFSESNSSLVGIENIIVSRLHAAVDAAGEKLSNQTIPSTSTDSLLQWCARLGISYRAHDKEGDIRNRCIARYLLAAGPTLINIETAVQALTGPAFVAIHYTTGTNLDTEPVGTYWAGGNNSPPIPGQCDLGDGYWISPRCYVLVELQKPPTMTIDELHYLGDVQLFDLMRRLLPAYATFSWALNLGFHLDYDELDHTTLTRP